MSNAIRHIRKTIFGETQKGFAKIAGVSQSTVSNWERGEWEPTLDNISRVRSEALRRGLEWSDAVLFEPVPSHEGAAA